MTDHDWEPNTFEDRLLQAYLEDHPGQLFLEVRVGGSENSLSARRIDGILVPDSNSRAFLPQDYSDDQLRRAIDGREVHLIEAKRSLNRNVFGQVLAGRSLFVREFDAMRIRHVALCAAGEPDLEWVCGEHDVEVVLYPDVSARSGSQEEPSVVDPVARSDLRKEPDEARRTAFVAGWTDAVNGRLYKSVRKRKAHMNMGNLFGWIYGDRGLDFRLETWDRYVDQLGAPEALESE